jgi:ABC-type proline/glycine betaine transport system permease subunit/ABC-type proline/glycine betaine transport system substrate-binding protein
LLLGWSAHARADYCSSGRNVVFAGLNWESGEFITAVAQEILERGFGCRSETIPGNTMTFEQAVANDDVQIVAEEWIERSEIWKKAAKAGQVRAVGRTFTGATEGWAVPEYVVKGDAARHLKPVAPDLTSVAQLADPKYVALFKDPEQPDRGRFLNCPSGWTCEPENTKKLEAYGLDGRYVDFRPGTGPAMDAAIMSAYLQGQPLLFYYWSPSAIAGRLRLTALAEPAYTPDCWNDMVSADGRHARGCASPPSVIVYGLSSVFAAAAPEIVAVLERANFPLADLNANLATMAQLQRDAKTQAVAFLKARPDIWQPWVGPVIAARIDTGLRDQAEQSVQDAARATSLFPPGLVVSIRRPVNEAVAALVTRHGAAFRTASHAFLNLIVLVDTGLGLIPWWLLIGIFVGLAWTGSRRPALSLAVGVLMFVVGMLGLWDLMLQTLTLMLISSGVALVIGLPVGILTAKSPWVRAVTLPTLDVMQTMPSFVYLIPALMLFGLGKVPAILATVIYALPPMIRLTALGIDQVDAEIKEAATAFGVTPLQMLLTVELPLARPSIMAGVNQTIMLALSMVVVASMIGARGLGERVLNGIQSLDIGQGLEAGIGIVILAVVLDRITQGFGGRRGVTGPGGRGKHG